MRPIFCGNLEFDSRQNDLERLFRRYGKVERVDMKSGKLFFMISLFWYCITSNSILYDLIKTMLFVLVFTLGAQVSFAVDLFLVILFLLNGVVTLWISELL